MSYLVFCSFEVGGLPYAFAEAMNHQEIPTYYISLANASGDHDSSSFHYGVKHVPWDISRKFGAADERNDRLTVESLSQVRQRYGIRAAFASGVRAHLLNAASIPYIYWSYGSDLDQVCHPPYPRSLLSKQEWGYYLYCLKHRVMARTSIRFAREVMIAPYQRLALDRFCDQKKFFLPHLIESRSYNEVLAYKSAARESLKNRFDAEELLFSSVRHCWSGAKSRLSDNKGNDILIDAFAGYLRKSGQSLHKLVLVEKGPDVRASKARILKLGIESNVAWVPEMKRSDLQLYLAGASVFLGQFGTPVLTGAVLEPLAWATPSISNFGGIVNGVPYYETLPPVLNVATIEGLTNAMLSLLGAPQNQYLNFKAGWEWIVTHCSEASFVTHAKRALDFRDPTEH